MTQCGVSRARARLIGVTVAVSVLVLAFALAGGPLRAESSKTPTTQPADANATDAADSKDTEKVKYFSAPEGGWKKDVETGWRKKVPLSGLEKSKYGKVAWFHLAVPKDYTPEKKWPLMVLLHGGPGGKPDDIVGFFRGGLLERGVIQVYPNAIIRQLLEWNYPHSGAYILQVVRQVAVEYRIDPRRVYLAGVSMGGGGTWVQGALGRDVWAAIGPISGWYGASQSPSVELLKGVPIYCMHGSADPAVPASRSRYAFSLLKKFRAVKAYSQTPDPNDLARHDCIYREVQGAGHNCFLPWKKRGAIELGKMMGWMLSRKREDPADLDKWAAYLARHGKRFGWKAKGSPVGTYGDADTGKRGKRDD
ncbi:MAG: hypothetical protein ACLFV7_12720 [Phycisphaerae bacterium]